MTRNQQKTILYPERYSSSSFICGSVTDAAKTRSIYTNTFPIMYGSTPYKLLTSRVKKGSGKGKLRMQKVVSKQRNLFDNSTIGVYSIPVCQMKLYLKETYYEKYNHHNRRVPIL